MSWISHLCDTYDNCQSLIGQEDEKGKVLLPLSHSTQRAQIEVLLNTKGEIIYAQEVSKQEAVTLIPVTVDSGTRSSNCAPHPLHDKLKYVAGDYCSYVDGAKEKDESYHLEYLSNLRKWCESDYSHQTANAIYQYVSKGTLISDLITKGILELEGSKLKKSKKIEGIFQGDAFVRFYVDDSVRNIERPWKDQTLQMCYVDYCLMQQNKTDLCYISGEWVPCSDKHPAKVMHEGDKAKLISSNDSSNFTFRGRFKDKNEAFSIGYVSSQKAHNALQWLIQRQGYRKEGMALVAWETTLHNLPDICGGSGQLFTNIEDKEEESLAGTASGYAKRLNRAINSYSCDLDEKNQVVILEIKSATEGQGRLSVAYYSEMNGSEFLDRIKNWHSTCIWEHSYKTKEGKRISFIGAPSLIDIALAAYGTESGKAYLEMDPKLQNNTIERLLPCVLNGKSLPADLIHAAYERALRPQSMSESNWNKVVTVTCALLKKYRKDKFEEDWSMNVNEKEISSAYLCGRLLAVMDEIERWALAEKEQNRSTNARRYFNQFAKNPNKMLPVINNKVDPYIQKLGYKKARRLLELKEDISSMIPADEFINLRNLDGRFILGFDAQKRELREYKIQKSIENKSQGGN